MVDWPARRLDHPLAGLLDPRLTFLVRKAQQRVGIGDIEVAADQRHPEGRMQAVEEHGAGVDDAVAVGIAQQGDAIGARHPGAGALQEEPHRPAFDAAAALAGGGIGLGHQHVAVRQHMKPARMIQPVGEGRDAQGLAGHRRGAFGPAFGRRDLHGRDQRPVRWRQLGLGPHAGRFRKRRALAAADQGERRHDQQQHRSGGLVMAIGPVGKERRVGCQAPLVLQASVCSMLNPPARLPLPPAPAAAADARLSRQLWLRPSLLARPSRGGRSAHLDLLPEADASGDLLHPRARVLVGPCRARVPPALDHHVVELDAVQAFAIVFRPRRRLEPLHAHRGAGK